MTYEANRLFMVHDRDSDEWLLLCCTPGAIGLMRRVDESHDIGTPANVVPPGVVGVFGKVADVALFNLRAGARQKAFTDAAGRTGTKHADAFRRLAENGD